MSDTMRVLTEEAIKMRKFPDITFTHGPTGRRATFIHGLDVWEILGVSAYPVLGKDMLHSYPSVYMPAAGTAERGACVPRG